jgi:hypothetical protein
VRVGLLKEVHSGTRICPAKNRNVDVSVPVD